MPSTSTLLRRHSIPELTPHAELALLARILWREGYDDHQVGHMTYRQPDGTYLAPPLELGWNEVCASDVLRIDGDGNLLEGTCDGATTDHLAYRIPQSQAGNERHPPPPPSIRHYLVGCRELPPVYDQLSAMLPDTAYVLYDDYDGTAEQLEPVRTMVAAIGGARRALLRNHGVFVVGDNIEQAYLNALSLEWRCRQSMDGPRPGRRRAGHARRGPPGDRGWDRPVRRDLSRQMGVGGTPRARPRRRRLDRDDVDGRLAQSEDGETT